MASDEQLAIEIFKAAKFLADAIKNAEDAGLRVSPPANGYFLTGDNPDGGLKYVSMANLKNFDEWSILRDVGNGVISCNRPDTGIYWTMDSGMTWKTGTAEEYADDQAKKGIGVS